MQIKDRVLIVTGASSGIGKATAIALTNKGGRVALLARNQSELEELSSTLEGSLPLKTDVTDFPTLKASIKKAYDHFGQIDGLINNAGRAYQAKVENIDDDVFNEIMRLNVLAPIIAMQAVIPIMRNQKEGGAIVNINSGTAFMAIPAYGTYSCSKRALLGVSMTAREELQCDNIIVSEVYPYITDTNFGKNKISASESVESVDYSQGDSPEYVAGIIINAIEEGCPQYFANKHIEGLATGKR